MTEIDAMDFLGFLRIRSWNAHRERHHKEESRRAYIDTVWKSLKPSGRVRHG